MDLAHPPQGFTPKSNMEVTEGVVSHFHLEDKLRTVVFAKLRRKNIPAATID